MRFNHVSPRDNASNERFELKPETTDCFVFVDLLYPLYGLLASPTLCLINRNRFTHQPHLRIKNLARLFLRNQNRIVSFLAMLFHMTPEGLQLQRP